MSDAAQKAWEDGPAKWPIVGNATRDRHAAFLAGFAAGQVDALEQAAEAFQKSPRFHDRDAVVAGLLRDMATQLRDGTR